MPVIYSESQDRIIAAGVTALRQGLQPDFIATSKATAIVLSMLTAMNMEAINLKAGPVSIPTMET